MSKPASPWLYSPAVDLIVGCGAWSLPLLAITLALQDRHSSGVVLGFYLLGVFCNNPHYMATVYRAYRTSADFSKYRFFTVYVTVLLLITGGLVHLAPGLFPWLLTLYILWSPWHYTGQNFGIAQMFIRRSGAPPDPVARQLLWLSYACAYAGWFVAINSRRQASDGYFLSLRLSPRITDPLEALFAAVFFGCAITAFVRTARASCLKAILGPATLTSAQMLWFVLPIFLSHYGTLQLSAGYFTAGALAFMHCAQYLWITTFFAKKESEKASVPFSFFRYYGLLIIGGIALFVPGPWISSRLFGQDFVVSFLIFSSLVNLHHFVLDGAIWKLRDGRIARLLLGSSSPEPGSDELHGQGPLRPIRWAFGASRTAGVLRISVACGLLAIGAVDQWQSYLTRRQASGESLARASALNPSDTRALFGRAKLLDSQGDREGAVRELRQIISINAHNVQAQRMLGELLLKSGDAQAALAQYDLLATTFPLDVVVATNRGVLAQALGRYDEAARDFSEGLQIEPDENDLHSLLAGALDAGGHSREAAEEYERFLSGLESSAIEPAGGVEKYLTAAIRLGDLYAREHTGDKAQHWYQRAADVAVAKKDFEKAATALNHLASVQEANGQPASAEKNRQLAAQVASMTPGRP